MRPTFQLEEETRNDLEKEKEQTIKEVIKELLLDVQNTKEEIKLAQERHEEAKKRYTETITDNNLLMKLCLKKVTTQPK